jgi:hypothetical protein
MMLIAAPAGRRNFLSSTGLPSASRGAGPKIEGSPGVDTRKFCGALLVVVLAGCGGLQSEARADVSFSSSADLRDALNKAGLACAGYQAVTSSDREMDVEGADDVGSCKVQNEGLSLIIWKDNAQRDNWVGFIKTTGCRIVKAFGESTFDYVVGDRWTIEQPSQTLADQIAGAIGGTAGHVSC